MTKRLSDPVPFGVVSGVNRGFDVLDGSGHRQREGTNLGQVNSGRFVA